MLDAAKNALDSDAGDKDRLPRFGGVSLFTLPGKHKKPAQTPKKEQGLPLSTGDFVSVDQNSSTSRIGLLSASSRTTDQSPKNNKALPAPSKPAASANFSPSEPKRSPEREIALRKARRRLSKILAISTVAIITVGLLVAAGGYLYKDYQIQQNHVVVLDEALKLVADADATIKTLDELVSDPFKPGNDEARASIQADLESAEKKLQEADDKARAVSLELNDPRDKEAANQTVAAIAARRTLIEQGQLLMAAATEAQDASERIDAAWKTVLEGDELARQAAKLVTDTTIENVEASKTKTNEAIASLDSALAEFADVQETYTSADLTPLVDYVEKRRESLGYALASDDAFLAKSKEEATAQNNAYNVADAEAAALAKALPEDPSSIVDEAFAGTTEKTLKAYSTARLQAGTADAFIRDYLGTGTK